MERLDLFAIPIFRGMLAGFDAERAALLGLVERERGGSAGLSVSNRGGFRSGNALHASPDPAMRYLVRAILEFSVGALGPLLGGFRSQDLALSECWANVDGPGAFHTPHCHHPAAWSGVVYVSAEQSLATDPASREGKIELLSPVPVPQAFAVPTGVTVAPRDGMILLFPAGLPHLVHPHHEESERVSIAFNLDVVERKRGGERDRPVES